MWIENLYFSRSATFKGKKTLKYIWESEQWTLPPSFCKKKADFEEPEETGQEISIPKKNPSIHWRKVFLRAIFNEPYGIPSFLLRA